MLSMNKLFSEVSNVVSEHPSGIIAPFGIIDPSKQNKTLLAKAQDLNQQDLDQQVRFINKLKRL